MKYQNLILAGMVFVIVFTSILCYWHVCVKEIEAGYTMSESTIYADDGQAKKNKKWGK